MEQTKRRILIVDHNMLLREGLCSLVHLQPDMELVGVARSAKEAVLLFCEHRPEVVLMDLDLPGVDGIRSIREMRELDSSVCILGLLTHPGDERAVSALSAGARGYIAKDRLNHDLVMRIRECLYSGA